MRLIKLSNKTYDDIKGRNICCVEKSASYMDELCASYDVLDHISCIVDENARNHGGMQYQDRRFRVYALEYLKSLDLEHTVILITSDYYREYYDKICGLLGAGAAGQVYFFADRETEYELAYREKYSGEPLQDIIVFRSGPHASQYVRGMDFSDNARALFEYMISVGLNRKYELVWLVKDPGKFEAYTRYENVSFLPYEGSVTKERSLRDEYYRALCLAKYFFFTDAYGFARNCREDQVRVQLWHGCGYKTRLNFTPCEKRYEYMTVTSELYADIHAKIFGLREDQLLVTGCAKEDWLFDDAFDRLSRLGIPKASRYLFWLPTYRFSEKDMEKPQDGRLNDVTGLPMISSYEDLKKVNETCAALDILLLVKLHPFQDQSAVHCEECSNIILVDQDMLLDQDIQINQLLNESDALISDYSSAAVDYMLLDKPMAFILDDFEEYSSERGFIFENIRDWLPGKELAVVQDLLDFMYEVSAHVDSGADKRRTLLKKMHKHQDGSNCRRIVEALHMI